VIATEKNPPNPDISLLLLTVFGTINTVAAMPTAPEQQENALSLSILTLQGGTTMREIHFSGKLPDPFLKIESTILHEKSPVFGRRLEIFPFSCFPKSHRRFWEVISNRES